MSDHRNASASPRRRPVFTSSKTGAYRLRGAASSSARTWARLLDESERLNQAILDEGVTVVGSAGQPRVHPGVGELRQHGLALGRLFSHSRSRIWTTCRYVHLRRRKRIEVRRTVGRATSDRLTALKGSRRVAHSAQPPSDAADSGLPILPVELLDQLQGRRPSRRLVARRGIDPGDRSDSRSHCQPDPSCAPSSIQCTRSSYGRTHGAGRVGGGADPVRIRLTQQTRPGHDPVFEPLPSRPGLDGSVRASAGEPGTATVNVGVQNNRRRCSGLDLR